jgi:5-methylcytosine-specific restriction endonuclease McrA
MKNLTLPAQKIEWYQRITSQKREPARRELATLHDRVLEKYEEYETLAHLNQLVAMPNSAFTQNEKTALSGCMSTKHWSELRAHIKLIQTLEAQAICQMCGIGEPITFDHFLPKEAYPEFTVLSINLLPSCSICNSKKGDRWKDAGERIYINLYYDVLPTEKYLSCTYVESNGIPIIKFVLTDTGEISRPLLDLIQSHFTNLDLLRRYEERANSELFLIKDPLQKMITSLDRVTARTMILEHAYGLRLKYGQNCWRTAIAEALAGSDDFMTSAGL